MTLDTKNLNEKQLAEIQKQIDELAATNKRKLPFHLRQPEEGEMYWRIHSFGHDTVEDCWEGDSIDITSRDYGNASLDVSFLEFTNEQRRAYIKILRCIAEEGLKIVDEPCNFGWCVYVHNRVRVVINYSGHVYNSIPKLKHREHADTLIDKCTDEIHTVLSWYVPEVKDDN